MGYEGELNMLVGVEIDFEIDIMPGARRGADDWFEYH